MGRGSMSATQAGSVPEPSPRSASIAARQPATPFFGLSFGQGGATDAGRAVVPVPLRPLGGGPAWQIWDGAGVPEDRCSTGIVALRSPDHVVLHKCVPVDDGADIAALALAVYRELLTRGLELGYPNLVRIWNFVPEINRGAGDEETYVLFNHGRKAAFDLLGFAATRYPAATGVGSPAGSPLTVVVAASRVEPIALENPRQTSAYHYPRRYGPRAPAFARAMLLPVPGGATLFVSGTASIVGHESQHRGIESQLSETLANLARLTGHATAVAAGLEPGARRRWVVYLRDPADLPAVEPEIRRQLGGAQHVTFLQADLCRRELLLEIEGVCELVRAPAVVG
jgi:chorismate lyase/3-hydroxybenzoate synthase